MTAAVEFIEDGWGFEDVANQPRLFVPDPVSTRLFEVDPGLIEVRSVDCRRVVHLQREMSRVVWRPSPGRNIAFIVVHLDVLLGIGFLASPILNLSVRDQYLELPAELLEKGQALRHYADLSVCVGAQPWAWHWNGGKLIAALATTLGDLWVDAYGDDLRGITTTSVWGRGSQYNRLYKFLGYSKGHGHSHVPTEHYIQIKRWLDERGIKRSTRTSSSARMRNLDLFKRHAGESTAYSSFHGEQRGVYFAPAVSSDNRPAVIHQWYERWGKPRYERTKDRKPPYQSGLA